MLSLSSLGSPPGASTLFSATERGPEAWTTLSSLRLSSVARDCAETTTLSAIPVFELPNAPLISASDANSTNPARSVVAYTSGTVVLA